MHSVCLIISLHLPFFAVDQKLPVLEKRLISLNSGDKNAVKSAIEEFSVDVQLDENSVLNK